MLLVIGEWYRAEHADEQACFLVLAALHLTVLTQCHPSNVEFHLVGIAENPDGNPETFYLFKDHHD